VAAPLRLVVHFYGARDPRLVKGLLLEYFPRSDITDDTITLGYKTYDELLRALRRVHDVCLDYGADMEVIEVKGGEMTRAQMMLSGRLFTASPFVRRRAARVGKPTTQL
jgi:hypothetical protein